MSKSPVVVNLVLVGRTGVGKSTIGRALSSLTGRPLIEIGDLVRRGAAEKGQTPLARAQEIFARGHDTHFVTEAVAEAHRMGLPCIISGPRKPVELDFIREQLRPTLALALSLPDSERRLRTLARQSGNLSRAALENRESVEDEWGIRETLNRCNFSVNTMADSETVLAQCLEKWLDADEGTSRE